MRKPFKYEPYHSSTALKTREAERRNKWFIYDPYIKEKVDAKALDSYIPNTPTLIHEEPIHMKFQSVFIKSQEKQRTLIISVLIKLFQPFFRQVSFVISNATQSLLNTFKRNK